MVSCAFLIIPQYHFYLIHAKAKFTPDSLSFNQGSGFDPNRFPCQYTNTRPRYPAIYMVMDALQFLCNLY